MPRTQTDYSRTIIYKIVCNDLNIKDIYVGHTTEFVKRKYKHKYSCNHTGHHTHNYEIYKEIRKNGGWDNWSMLEIEKYPCSDGNEARARERFWYEDLKATLNMVVPCRSRKEYYDTHKEQIGVAMKTKIENNYELFQNRWKQYREDNKEKIATYREANRAELNRKQNEKRAQKRAEKKALSQQPT